MSSEPPASLSAMIRTYRRRAGLTQQQLADLSTISLRAIRDLEAGRTKQPRAGTINLLADGLQVEVPQRLALEAAASQTDTMDPLAAEAGEAVRRPAPTSSLIGREAEVDLVKELLNSGDERMVALVGLGGVGKTRLALEIAEWAAATGPVLWMAETACGRSHPAAASGGYTATRTTHGEALANGAGMERLGRAIGTKSALLIVDDHDGHAPDSLVELLRRCPQTRILLTCRDPRRAPGTLVPVPPLPVPTVKDGDDPADLIQVASVRLLVRHVRRMHPTWRLDAKTAPAVGAICRHLDGLPGALALVGHWSLLYPSDRVLDQLAEGLPVEALTGSGKHPLLEVVGWVDHALSSMDEEVRYALENLAAIPNPWTLRDAEECVHLASDSVADAVHLLLLYGLVRRAAAEQLPGFRVVNTVRMMLNSVPSAAGDGRCVPPPGTVTVGVSDGTSA